MDYKSLKTNCFFGDFFIAHFLINTCYFNKYPLEMNLLVSGWQKLRQWKNNLDLNKR